MKIVLYSTLSSVSDNQRITNTFLPRCADQWDKMAELYPEHELILVTKMPGAGFLDTKDGELIMKSDKIKYVIVGDDDSVEKISELIYNLAPAVAVAVSLPSFPIDWNTIKDAMIAERLEKYGIKTIAHKALTSIILFDKARTSFILSQLGFAVAESRYVHNELFWAERTNPGIRINVFKEYILQRVKEMTFPVIIKDTVGAGSRGIIIAGNYEEAEKALIAEENNTDLIVEEFVQGEQFGTEIHGVKGKYHVLAPFIFSTNKAGITDPFQSVKFGPVTNAKYNIPQLQETLRRMADTFEFAGCTQVDLVFKDGKWYVLEINPRWSGMTITTAAAQGRSPYSIFIESATGSKLDYSKWENLKYVLNFKTPPLKDEERVYSFPNVKNVTKYVSTLPGNEIEYCEVVYGGFDTKEELLEGLKKLRDAFPDAVSPLVIQNAEKLSENA